ncbi:alkyl sulfatase C-terminal domain-containing protein [Streptomyces chartreusis]
MRRPPPDSGCTASTGASLDGIEHEGDVGVLTGLLGLLDEPDPDFAIVTP